MFCQISEDEIMLESFCFNQGTKSPSKIEQHNLEKIMNDKQARNEGSRRLDLRKLYFQNFEPSGCYTFRIIYLQDNIPSGFYTFRILHLQNVIPSECYTFRIFYLQNVTPSECYTIRTYIRKTFFQSANISKV